MADAYDFWADRLTPEETRAVDGFWAHFDTIHAELDKAFSGGDTDIDPAEATMDAIGPLEDSGIFWEYGPSDRGHHLALSPELLHEARPLARALLRKAPDLPRWRFYDGRPPSALDENSVGMVEARAQVDFPLTGIRPVKGEHNRVDFIGEGKGDEDTLGGMAGLTFSVLFGEAVERDWLGEIQGESKGGLGGLFSRAPDPMTWLPGFVEETQSLIKSIEDQRPEKPLATPLSGGAEIALFNLTPQSEEIGQDLITYSTAFTDLAGAMFAGARISMPRFTRFDESFCGIAIARSEAQPFDQVTERGELAEALNKLLGEAGVASVMGEGHGAGHVYIDLFVSDIPQALAISERLLGQVGIAGPAWFRFHEAGLEDRTVPLTLTAKPS